METKICSFCKQEKNIEEFNWRISGIKRQCHCKICQSAQTKQHYKNNPTPYKNRSKSKKLSYQKLIYSYLLEHPCVDCGESDPIVLEFDHRNNKEHHVSRMQYFSEENIMEEINKCDVRCANCHKRRHHIEGKDFKYVLGL